VLVHSVKAKIKRRRIHRDGFDGISEIDESQMESSKYEMMVSFIYMITSSAQFFVAG